MIVAQCWLVCAMMPRWMLLWRIPWFYGHGHLLFRIDSCCARRWWEQIRTTLPVRSKCTLSCLQFAMSASECLGGRSGGDFSGGLRTALNLTLRSLVLLFTLDFPWRSTFIYILYVLLTFVATFAMLGPNGNHERGGLCMMTHIYIYIHTSAR